MERLIGICLEESDYFKEPMKLIFNQKETVSTRVGKLLSFIIYGLTFALVIKSGTDIYNRTNPITTQINKVAASAPIVNMKDKQLVLMSQFSDRHFVHFDDPSLFTVEISQFKVERFHNGTFTVNYLPIKRNDCSNYKPYFAQKNFSKNFDSNNLATGFCFDVFNQTYLIGGAFTSKFFSNINYKLKRCVNSTNSPIICKPKSKIDDVLKNGYFGITYIDNYIDTDNFGTPAIEHFSNYFIKTDPQLFKFVDIFFKVANIHTDSGLIFDSDDVVSRTMYDFVREQVSLSEDDLIIDFYFNISTNVLKVSRVCMKLQTLTAIVGGIFKVLIVFGSVLTYNFNKLKMYEYLINFLFDSEELHNTKKNVNVFFRINPLHIDKSSMTNFNNSDSKIKILDSSKLRKYNTSRRKSTIEIKNNFFTKNKHKRKKIKSNF